MKINNKILIYLFVFILGLFFVITNKPKSKLENFSINQCPNVLIKKGNQLQLLNNKLARIPGRNPIIFNNLNEYIEYLNWQRSQNINCPVLFLENSIDIQGNNVFKQRNSIFEFDGGVPPISTFGENNQNSMLLNASRNNLPFNINQMPGFDPDNQYDGLITPLDNMNSQSINGISASPMDHDWGGVEYTKDLVDSGYYKDNEVSIEVA